MRHFLYDSDEFDTVDTDRVTVGSRPPSRDREEGDQVEILEDSDADGEDEMNTDSNNIPSNFHLF